MNKLVSATRKFAVQEEGASLIEYSLMLALLAAACIAILWGISTNIRYVFSTTDESVRSASGVITTAS